jgi:hypothetical protein
MCVFLLFFAEAQESGQESGQALKVTFFASGIFGSFLRISRNNVSGLFSRPAARFYGWEIGGWIKLLNDGF